MTSGVRTELAVHAPANCPVVATADETDSRVTGVSWARTGADRRNDGDDPERAAVEEFRVPLGADDAVPDRATPLMDVDGRRVYRIERDGACPCGRIERLGYPIVDVQATGEAVFVTLHLAALGELRDIVAEVGALADRVEVRSLVHESVDVDAAERPVVVDRGRLTERQREALRTAVEMGYFDHPRDSNATEVAAELDITLSTFTQHLTAAQSKLFDGMLSG